MVPLSVMDVGFLGAVGGGACSTEGTATHKDETQDDQISLFGGNGEGQAEVILASSVLIGEKVTKLGMQLRKKSGQSPTGTITFAVLDSSNAILFTFGTHDAATLANGVFNWVEKENLTAYTLSQGERIGIKYTGGNTTNRIEVGFHVVGSFDGTTTVSSHYDAGWVDTSGRDNTFRLYKCV